MLFLRFIRLNNQTTAPLTRVTQFGTPPFLEWQKQSTPRILPSPTRYWWALLTFAILVLQPPPLIDLNCTIILKHLYKYRDKKYVFGTEQFYWNCYYNIRNTAKFSSAGEHFLFVALSWYLSGLLTLLNVSGSQPS